MIHAVNPSTGETFCGLRVITRPIEEGVYWEPKEFAAHVPAGERCAECATSFPRVYVLPEENRAPVEKKLAELNRRAAKLGVEPVSMTFVHDHIEVWTTENPLGETLPRIEHSRVWLAATLNRKAVALPGWTFLATLYHSTEGNILASVPGSEVPRAFRNAPSACHHCHQVRRRNVTYIVRHDDGHTVQVGSSCLRDFLGHNAEAMASWAEYLGAFDLSVTSEYSEDRGPRSVFVFSLRTFLLASAAAIRVDGWVSRKLASETQKTSTASRAWGLLTVLPGSKEARELAKEYANLPGDESLADAVLAWARDTFSTEPEKGWSDYEHNLGVVVRSDLVSWKTAGLAASLIQSYRRSVSIADDRAAQVSLVSEWQGRTGERLSTIPVTVQAIIAMPATDFGPRNLLKFADDSGNVYAWFTGSYGSWVFPGAEQPREPKKGDRMWLTGTVKKHSSFSGTKQTEMSRCLLASIEPAPKKEKKARRTA